VGAQLWRETATAWESERMSRRVRVNPFEVVMWILGLALLAAGVAGALWASRVMNGGFSCVGDDCSAPVDYALAQALYMMTPPLVTAGLVTVVVSLAVRAVLTGIAHRSAVRDAPVAETQQTHAEQTQAEQSQTVGAVGWATAEQAGAQHPAEYATARTDPASFAPPQFRPRRAADHSAFKRPTAD
jgi:hypothetical protein